jgi:hypothetical protein
MTHFSSDGIFRQKSVGQTQEHIDPAAERAAERATEQRQKEREKEADEHLTPWAKPQKDDYGFFQNWAKGASEERLQAGHIWEYARESRKLRGLLWLMKHKPEAAFINPLFNMAIFWFEGLCEYDARRVLGGWFKWLAYLADDLAENISFEKLVNERPDELVRAFRSVPSHEFFQANAVEFASTIAPFSALGAPITLLDTPERERVCYDGSEVIALRIPWGGLRNGQIGKEMGKFAALHRPANESCKEPRRRPSTFRSYLKALSVMRIWKLHKGKPWRRLELVAEVCGYKDCKREWAAYKRRCKGGHGDAPMSKAAQVEMTRARQLALSVFHCLFPRETPENYSVRLS